MSSSLNYRPSSSAAGSGGGKISPSRQQQSTMRVEAFDIITSPMGHGPKKSAVTVANYYPVRAASASAASAAATTSRMGALALLRQQNNSVSGLHSSASAMSSSRGGGAAAAALNNSYTAGVTNPGHLSPLRGGGGGMNSLNNTFSGIPSSASNPPLISSSHVLVAGEPKRIDRVVELKDAAVFRYHNSPHHRAKIDPSRADLDVVEEARRRRAIANSRAEALDALERLQGGGGGGGGAGSQGGGGGLRNATSLREYLQQQEKELQREQRDREGARGEEEGGDDARFFHLHPHDTTDGASYLDHRTSSFTSIASDPTETLKAVKVLPPTFHRVPLSNSAAAAGLTGQNPFDVATMTMAMGASGMINNINVVNNDGRNGSAANARASIMMAGTGGGAPPIVGWRDTMRGRAMSASVAANTTAGGSESVNAETTSMSEMMARSTRTNNSISAAAGGGGGGSSSRPVSRGLEAFSSAYDTTATAAAATTVERRKTPEGRIGGEEVSSSAAPPPAIVGALNLHGPILENGSFNSNQCESVGGDDAVTNDGRRSDAAVHVSTDTTSTTTTIGNALMINTARPSKQQQQQQQLDGGDGDTNQQQQHHHATSDAEGEGEGGPSSPAADLQRLRSLRQLHRKESAANFKRKASMIGGGNGGGAATVSGSAPAEVANNGSFSSPLAEGGVVDHSLRRIESKGVSSQLLRKYNSFLSPTILGDEQQRGRKSNGDSPTASTASPSSPAMMMNASVSSASSRQQEYITDRQSIAKRVKEIEAEEEADGADLPENFWSRAAKHKAVRDRLVEDTKSIIEDRIEYERVLASLDAKGSPALMSSRQSRKAMTTAAGLGALDARLAKDATKRTKGANGGSAAAAENGGIGGGRNGAGLFTPPKLSPRDFTVVTRDANNDFRPMPRLSGAAANGSGGGVRVCAPDFDDHTAHRLWKLEDKANVALPGTEEEHGYAKMSHKTLEDALVVIGSGDATGNNLQLMGSDHNEQRQQQRKRSLCSTAAEDLTAANVECDTEAALSDADDNDNDSFAEGVATSSSLFLTANSERGGGGAMMDRSASTLANPFSATTDGTAQRLPAYIRDTDIIMGLGAARQEQLARERLAEDALAEKEERERNSRTGTANSRGRSAAAAGVGFARAGSTCSSTATATSAATSQVYKTHGNATVNAMNNSLLASRIHSRANSAAAARGRPMTGGGGAAANTCMGKNRQISSTSIHFRPSSGDLLTRQYQLRAIAKANARAEALTQNELNTANGTNTATGGNNQKRPLPLANGTFADKSNDVSPQHQQVRFETGSAPLTATTTPQGQSLSLHRNNDNQQFDLQSPISSVAMSGANSPSALANNNGHSHQQSALERSAQQVQSMQRRLRRAVETEDHRVHLVRRHWEEDEEGYAQAMMASTGNTSPTATTLALQHHLLDSGADSGATSRTVSLTAPHMQLPKMMQPFNNNGDVNSSSAANPSGNGKAGFLLGGSPSSRPLSSSPASRNVGSSSVSGGGGYGVATFSNQTAKFLQLDDDHDDSTTDAARATTKTSMAASRGGKKLNASSSSTGRKRAVVVTPVAKSPRGGGRTSPTPDRAGDAAERRSGSSSPVGMMASAAEPTTSENALVWNFEAERIKQESRAEARRHANSRANGGNGMMSDPNSPKGLFGGGGGGRPDSYYSGDYDDDGEDEWTDVSKLEGDAFSIHGAAGANGSNSNHLGLVGDAAFACLSNRNGNNLLHAHYMPTGYGHGGGGGGGGSRQSSISIHNANNSTTTRGSRTNTNAVGDYATNNLNYYQYSQKLKQKQAAEPQRASTALRAKIELLERSMKTEVPNITIKFYNVGGLADSMSESNDPASHSGRGKSGSDNTSPRPNHLLLDGGQSSALRNSSHSRGRKNASNNPSQSPDAAANSLTLDGSNAMGSSVDREPVVEVARVGHNACAPLWQKTSANGKDLICTPEQQQQLQHQLATSGGPVTPRTTIEDVIAAKEYPPMPFEPRSRRVTSEMETYMPPQELHLYQMYCANSNVVIMIRPISSAAPSMYAGNFFVPAKYCDEDGIPLPVHEIKEELDFDQVMSFTTSTCRIKGKGIGVSLKSSPYTPIEGFIPINPSLSKTYSEARRKERQLEDNLMRQTDEKKNRGIEDHIRNASDKISMNLLAKIRAQHSMFGAATSVAMKDIEKSLESSKERLMAMVTAYNEESAFTVDKLSISEKYIDKLNEAQFLGKTTATWRGMDLYYRELNGNELEVERNNDGIPTFYARRGELLFTYDPNTNELRKGADAVLKYGDVANVMRKVEILTHKSFVISEQSKRIIKDPGRAFIIGPDFDGFAYAHQMPRSYYDPSAMGNGNGNAVGSDNPLSTSFANASSSMIPASSSSATVLDGTNGFVALCEDRVHISNVPSMGLVSERDRSHILEARALTEWKQNHGYECMNTVKTQEISEGSHIAILPTMEVRCLHTYVDILRFYRECWLRGYPLVLNPNWKVVLCNRTKMPVPFGDETSLPIVDDCGMALVTHSISVEGKSYDAVKAEALRISKNLEEQIAVKKAQNPPGTRVVARSTLSSSNVIMQLAVALAKKALAEKFYAVRRWLLMPPCFLINRRTLVSEKVYNQIALPPNTQEHDQKTAKGRLGGGRDIQSLMTDNSFDLAESVFGGMNSMDGEGGVNEDGSLNDGTGNTYYLGDGTDSQSSLGGAGAGQNTKPMYVTVPISEAFERYRESRIRPLLAAFEEACSDFEACYGSDSVEFTRMLRNFIEFQTEGDFTGGSAAAVLQGNGEALAEILKPEVVMVRDNSASSGLHGAGGGGYSTRQQSNASQLQGVSNGAGASTSGFGGSSTNPFIAFGATPRQQQGGGIGGATPPMERLGSEASQSPGSKGPSRANSRNNSVFESPGYHDRSAFGGAGGIGGGGGGLTSGGLFGTLQSLLQRTNSGAVTAAAADTNAAVALGSRANPPSTMSLKGANNSGSEPNTAMPTPAVGRSRRSSIVGPPPPPPISFLSVPTAGGGQEFEGHKPTKPPQSPNSRSPSPLPRPGSGKSRA